MATVLIWNNSIISGKLVPGRKVYSGHASLCIDDHWGIGGAAVNNYVSFWPSGGGAWQQANGVTSKANDTIISDLEAEGYAPDHVLRVNGLSVTNMRAEWSAARQEVLQYKTLRSSCATQVARVLKKGAGEGGWARHIVWTPLRVKRLANDIGAEPISWNLLLGELEAKNIITRSEATLLGKLHKRDERHGSSMQEAYFARGKRVEDKSILARRSGAGSPGFRIFAGGRAEPGIGESRAAAEVDIHGQMHTGTMTRAGSAIGMLFDRSWEQGN